MAPESGDQNEKETDSSGGEHKPRESVFGSLVSSVKYLQTAHSETDVVRLRKSDKITQALLVIALFIIVAAQFYPDQKSVCTALADLLMAVILLAFLMLRFGVLKTLQPRQAVLTWQLILGSFVLGMYLAFNIRMIALLQEGVKLIF